ncbi:MAG: hypothetical protein ACXQTD_09605 [Candidatus Syntropharchaeia archaeon]
MGCVIAWDPETGEFFIPFESLDDRECERYARDSLYDVAVPFGFSRSIDEKRLQMLLERYWMLYAGEKKKQRRFEWEKRQGHVSRR